MPSCSQLVPSNLDKQVVPSSSPRPVDHKNATKIQSQQTQKIFLIQFCSRSCITAFVLELHCEWSHHRIEVIQTATVFSWNSVKNSGISPHCFLYEIQKGQFRKQPAFLQSTFHIPGIYKDFYILCSCFWEVILIMDKNWQTSASEKWQKTEAIRDLLI